MGFQAQATTRRVAQQRRTLSVSCAGSAAWPLLGWALAWAALLALYAALAAPRLKGPMGPEESLAIARAWEARAADQSSPASFDLDAPGHWRPLFEAWLAWNLSSVDSEGGAVGAAVALPRSEQAVRALHSARFQVSLTPAFLALALAWISRRRGASPAAGWLGALPVLGAPLATDLIGSPEGWSALLSASWALVAALLLLAPAEPAATPAGTSAGRRPWVLPLGVLGWVAACAAVACGEVGALLLVGAIPLVVGRRSRPRWLPVMAMVLPALVALAVRMRFLLAELRLDPGAWGSSTDATLPSWLGGLLGSHAGAFGAPSGTGSWALGLGLLTLLAAVLGPVGARDRADGWRALRTVAIGAGWVLAGFAGVALLPGPFTGPQGRWVGLLPAFLGTGLAVGASVRSTSARGTPIVLFLGVFIWCADAGPRAQSRSAEDARQREVWTAHRQRAIAILTEERPAPGETFPASRSSVKGALIADLPVLDGSLPVPPRGSWRGPRALAASCAPPWAEVQRPLWPRSPLWGEARPVARRLERGLTWPDRVQTRNVPGIPLSQEGTLAKVGEWPLRFARLSSRALADSPIEFEIWGSYPEQRFELVLYTAHGYAACEIQTGPPEEASGPGGGRMLRRIASLSEALNGGLAAALRLADAFGERHAFLELRAVDDARGTASRPVASSDWWPIEWQRGVWSER